MDAGVPIKKMAAGIAMGLMSDPKTGGYKILTDIQGPEDHYGDMDFKVAGTKDGVTAIQLDVKIDGITPAIARETLAQARAARLHIIRAMEHAIAKPRTHVSPYAPSVLRLMINPEKIGIVIGPGGKTINSIIEETGIINIDIQQDGSVLIYAQSAEAAERARAMVADMTREYQIGDIIEGTVEKILEFGAIVEWGTEWSGMIHISELKNGFVKKVEDVLKLGDHVRARIIRMEDGKIALSLRDL
jgi:polyribonucleotide nucleotidyltransferase